MATDPPTTTIPVGRVKMLTGQDCGRLEYQRRRDMLLLWRNRESPVRLKASNGAVALFKVARFRWLQKAVELELIDVTSPEPSRIFQPRGPRNAGRHRHG